jgi:hypothetical protein
MQKWVTKNNVFFFGITAFLCSKVVRYLVQNDYCGSFWNTCLMFEDMFLPLFVLTLPILVLFFLRDELFRSWLRFLAWWLPVGYILSYGIGYSTGYISIELWNTRLTSFVILSFSLLLFVIKTWELRRQEAGTPIAPWLVWTTLVLAFAASLVPGYIYGLIW